MGEPEQAIYPLPSAEQIAERQRQIRARAEALEEDPIAEIIASGERAIARFSVLPCGGNREGIEHCAPSVHASCAEREAPGCPRQILAYEAAERIRIDEDRIAATGMPRRLARLALGELAPTNALAIGREWLPSENRALVMTGSAGVGKSVAAAWVLTVSRGLWVAAADLAKTAIEDKHRYARLRETPLLVVDDLGTDAPDKSGWSAAQVQALLCLRDDEGNRTLLTSNLDVRSLREAYGERVYDRFRGHFVGVGGKSMRGAS